MTVINNTVLNYKWCQYGCFYWCHSASQIKNTSVPTIKWSSFAFSLVMLLNEAVCSPAGVLFVLRHSCEASTWFTSYDSLHWGWELSLLRKLSELNFIETVHSVDGAAVHFVLEWQCFQLQITHTRSHYVWSAASDNEEPLVTHRRACRGRCRIGVIWKPP